MDPTTAALGYGLDYAYTNMERIRLAALMGDDELTFPMSSGTTNAWGARESWMVGSPLKKTLIGDQGNTEDLYGNCHWSVTCNCRKRPIHDDAPNIGCCPEADYPDAIRYHRHRAGGYCKLDRSGGVKNED